MPMITMILMITITLNNNDDYNGDNYDNNAYDDGGKQQQTQN